MRYRNRVFVGVKVASFFPVLRKLTYTKVEDGIRSSVFFDCERKFFRKLLV